LQKKEGFKTGMKERVGDEKLIIISVAVSKVADFTYPTCIIASTK